MSHVHKKYLVDLLHAQLVENMITSISNSNQNMKSPFKNTKKDGEKQVKTSKGHEVE
jgi:hypothetical protein